MRMRRCLVTAFGAVAMVVSVAVAPASGVGSMDPIEEPPPTGFRDWGEVFAVQDKLNTAADVITAAREANGDDGYAGIVAAPENRRLDVSWRGPVPPKVSQAIEDAKRDVPVSVAPARYSEAELLAEGNKIVPARGVSGVAPNADGGGLTVSVTGSESDGRAIPEVRDAKVPVTIDPFVTVEPTVASRHNDAPFYKGGARYTTPLGDCTTGIGVLQQGVHRMLSAGHCGKNGETAKDGGGENMGTIVNKNSKRDTLLINTPSALKVYVGPWNSTDWLPVSAAKSSKVGNYVCTSGAGTGSHCPHKVEAVNLAIAAPGGGSWTPMVRAKQIAAKIAVGHGDSGGTVTTWTVFPTSSAVVLGTISAGSGPVTPCMSVHCFSTVYYASITDTIKYYASVGVPMTVLTAHPPA